MGGIYIRLAGFRTENKVVSGWRHRDMLLSVVGEMGDRDNGRDDPAVARWPRGGGIGVYEEGRGRGGTDEVYGGE